MIYGAVNKDGKVFLLVSNVQPTIKSTFEAFGLDCNSDSVVGFTVSDRPDKPIDKWKVRYKNIDNHHTKKDWTCKFYKNRILRRVNYEIMSMMIQAGRINPAMLPPKSEGPYSTREQYKEMVKEI